MPAEEADPNVIQGGDLGAKVEAKKPKEEGGGCCSLI